MKKTWKRLCTGFLALATVVTALPTTPVHAESKQYWTESAERVGIIEKVMNDGSIGSTFNEGYMKVEGETAYCIDINTDFKNGYKTRADASSRMSVDQISDVALSLEYVKQYNIHCHFAEEKVRPDSRSCRDAGCLKHIKDDLYCKLVRRQLISFQIVRYVHEHFVDGVNHNVLRCDVLEVNLIDAGAVLHVVRHSRRRDDEVNRQRRVCLQL